MSRATAAISNSSPFDLFDPLSDGVLISKETPRHSFIDHNANTKLVDRKKHSLHLTSDHGMAPSQIRTRGRKGLIRRHILTIMLRLEFGV